MNKNKLLACLLFIFCLIISIGFVSASDDSPVDNLTLTDNSEQVNNLNVVENENFVDKIGKNEDFDSNLTKMVDAESNDNLSTSESVSSEILSQQVNSDDILSSSVSVSTGHTFKKMGFKFKVSASQYKKIKTAIKTGKHQKFLDTSFHFKVKTNKVVKVKVLVKSKTYYKKVKYERFDYPYDTKIADLNKYYKNGWKKYQTKWYYGYHYAFLKKTIKKYKTVKMRVYAKIHYIGTDEYVTGQHLYFPFVEFYAIKNGYHSKYYGLSVLN